MKRYRKSLAFMAVLCIVVVPGCSGSGGDRKPSKTGVDFDWSMPDRTRAVSTDSPIIEQYQPSYNNYTNIHNNCCSVPRDQILPQDWPVTLAANTKGDANMYQWEIAEEPSLNISGADAKAPTIRFRHLGEYHVTLKVVAANGQTTTVSKIVRVKDYLVVDLGDSYSSGEGAPDRPGTLSIWNDERCHRSAQAPAARFALRLERSSPRSSVTFIHLACSGAGIPHGIISNYEGTKPVDGRFLDPQIREVEKLVGVSGLGDGASGGRRIDALLMTIGGNDLGFAGIVEYCMAQIMPCDIDPVFQDLVRQHLSRLPGLFDKLNDDLHRLYNIKAVDGSDEPVLAPSRVFLSSYPAGVKRVDGDDDIDNFCGGDPGLPGLVKSEAKWLHNKLTRQLLGPAVEQAAKRHQWTAVQTPNFDGHGYCSSDPWVNTVEQSKRNQHDIGGTAHPNTRGYAAWADWLWDHLPHLQWQPQIITVINNDHPTRPITVNYRVTGTDPIDGQVTANCTPSGGSQFTLGTHQIHCWIQSWSGVLSRPYKVEVKDTIAPTVVSARFQRLADGEIMVVAKGVKDNGEIDSVVAQAWYRIEGSYRKAYSDKLSLRLQAGTHQLGTNPADTIQPGDWLATGTLVSLGSPISATPDNQWQVILVVTDTGGNTTTVQMGAY